MKRWAQLENALVAVLACWVALFCLLKLPHVLSSNYIEWDARAMDLAAFRFHGSGLFGDDLGVDLSSAMCPPGWKAIYWLGSLFTDPYQVSRLVPLVVLGLLLHQAYKFARPRGGVLVGVLTVFLIARCPFFWDRTVGANPRGFGLLLVVAFLRYASERRARAAAGVLVAQAMLYPSVMMFCAPAFAIQQLIEARRARSLVPVVLLTVCGLTCLAMALPSLLLADPRLGSPIRIEELGALRQSGIESLYPLPPHLWVIERGLHLALDDSMTPLEGAAADVASVVFRALAVVLLVIGVWRRRLPSIFAFTALAAGLTYALACAVAYRLYVPDRMLLYSLPPLLLLLLAPLALDAASLLPTRRVPIHARASIATLALLAPIVTFGGLGLTRDNGLRDWIGQDTPAIAFIAKQPRDVLVAAHPTTASFVEVFAHRSTLFSGITNAPNFNRYGKVVEDRIAAFYDAYYATKLDGVRAFLRRYGVDYLIVDTRDYGSTAYARARYVPPWTAYGMTLVHKARGHFALAKPPAEAVAYRSGPWLVIDGKRL